MLYDRDAGGIYPRTYSVLLELEASSGLCIPKREYRGTALFDHLFGIGFIQDAGAEKVVFPTSTRWNALSVEMTRSMACLSCA